MSLDCPGELRCSSLWSWHLRAFGVLKGSFTISLFGTLWSTRNIPSGSYDVALCFVMVSEWKVILRYTAVGKVNSNKTSPGLVWSFGSQARFQEAFHSAPEGWNFTQCVTSLQEKNGANTVQPEDVTLNLAARF